MASTPPLNYLLKEAKECPSSVTHVKLSDIDGSLLDDEEFQPVIKWLQTILPKFINLKHLDLSGLILYKKSIRKLARELRCLIGLITLDLSKNEMGDKGMKELVPALKKLTGLTTLYLCSNELEAKGMSDLAPALKKLTGLTTLDLSYNAVRAEGMKELVPALKKLTGLTTLNLGTTQLQAKGMSDLVPALKKLTGLTTLDLSYNAVRAEGMGKLTLALGQLTGLTTLNLSNNELGAEGMRKLAPALQRLTGLMSLNLGNSVVGRISCGDRGTEAFVLALLSRPSQPTHSLGGLSSHSPHSTLLNSNGIGEDGGVNFGESLVINFTLTELDLTNNQIGDIGFNAIADALPFLQTLNVNDNQITTIPLSLVDSHSLTLLKIHRNPLIDPSSEFVESASLDQLKAYLRAPRTEISRVRLLVVGYQDVGKTTLITRLQHPEVEDLSQLKILMPLDLSTHGIATVRLEVPHPERLDQRIKLNTLDFAGQPIYYSNHRHFLGQHRAVYMVVFRASGSPREAESEVRHWLSLIASQIEQKWKQLFADGRLAKPGVLVVGTSVDLIDNAKRAATLRSHRTWYSRVRDSPGYQSVFDFIQVPVFINHNEAETMEQLQGLLSSMAAAQLRGVPHGAGGSSCAVTVPLSLAVIANAVVEIERLRGERDVGKLFYIVEEFRKQILVRTNPSESAVIDEIGADNLAVQLQAMGDVLFIQKHSKVCIDPQRVFNMLANFVQEQREVEREAWKPCVKSEGGMVSLQEIENVCRIFNGEMQMDLSVELLLATLDAFDLCIAVGKNQFLFPALLPGNEELEQGWVNDFYADKSAARFSVQWQVRMDAGERWFPALLPSLMFSIHIACYRAFFQLPGFQLLPWPTGLLLSHPHCFKAILVMIKDTPGALRLSIQPYPAAIQRIDDFLDHLDKLFRNIFEQVRYLNTYLVNLCSGCSALRLIPEGEMGVLSVGVIDTALGLSVSHPEPGAFGKYQQSPLHLTLLRHLLKVHKTDLYICSKVSDPVSSEVSGCVFFHPKLLKMQVAPLPSQHPDVGCSSAGPSEPSMMTGPSSQMRSTVLNDVLKFVHQQEIPRQELPVEDLALWRFSAGIQTSQDNICYLQRSFELIRPQLQACFKESLGQVPLDGSPFEMKPQFEAGGGVVNRTFLIRPVLEMYLVVNSTKPLRVQPGGGKPVYLGRNGNMQDVPVNGAMVVTISKACAAALNQFLIQRQDFNTLETSFSPREATTAFTLRELKANHAGWHLEFDVMPVLEVVGKTFLLLDGKDGRLIPSNIQLAAHAIETYARDFAMLREMMVVLKLIHQAGILQGRSSLNRVPSCGLEMAVMLLVQDRSRDSSQWWRDSSFTTILHAAIAKLLEALQPGNRLPALNDPSDDVLRQIRHSPQEFVEYYTKWQRIEEFEMLGKLRECFDLVTSGPENSNRPTCSSSEMK